MKVDLVDLYSKSADRIDSKWKLSVLLNVVAVGWVIAIYIGITNEVGILVVPQPLKIMLLVLHFTVYMASCIDLMYEYRRFNEFNVLLQSPAKKLEGVDAKVVKALARRLWLLKDPHIYWFAILLHVFYASLIYSIILFPNKFLVIP